MPDRILVLYGSYRTDRKGIRLAEWLVRAFAERGADVELIDAKAIGLPMLDWMYKEHAPGEAPAALEMLADKIRRADAFVFVTGEYNWSVQPGLKNLTDHFLEEWFWRPAAIASYSGGRFAGARAGLTWHGILSEMGMVVVSSTLAVGGIGHAFDEGGERRARAERRWRMPSHGSPTTWPGGPRRRGRSGGGGRRRTEGSGKCAVSRVFVTFRAGWGGGGVAVGSTVERAYDGCSMRAGL